MRNNGGCLSRNPGTLEELYRKVKVINKTRVNIIATTDPNYNHQT